MDSEEWDEHTPRRRPGAVVVFAAIAVAVVIGFLVRPSQRIEDLAVEEGRLETGLDPTSQPSSSPTGSDAEDPSAPASPATAPEVEPTLSAFEPAARWEPLPDAPFDATETGPAVWDGRRMVLWPGRGHGGMYAPDVEAWAALPPAPVERSSGWSADWSGEEVLYWGGLGADGQPTADGVALAPAAARWRPLPPAPIAPRLGHGAVWGGGRLWVFGGWDASGRPLGDGASYDPATDQWEVLPAPPLSPRAEPIMLWIGEGLLVWGGLDGDEGSRDGAGLADGAIYRPVEGAGWTPIAPAPVPLRRTSAAVWTGPDCSVPELCRRLLVWGRPAASLSARDGYAYALDSDSWTALPLLLSQTRSDAVAHWAGDKAVIFGGRDQFDRRQRADGFVYDPSSHRWKQIPGLPADLGAEPAAVWTGRDLIVWGNGQGARYRIDQDLLRDGPSAQPGPDPTGGD